MGKRRKEGNRSALEVCISNLEEHHGWKTLPLFVIAFPASALVMQ